MYSPTLDANDAGGWNGFTLIERLEQALFTPPSGGITQVRITFQASSTEGCTIANAYVQHAAASGDLWDFLTTPVQLFWAGSGSKAIATGTEATTDWASFAYNKTSALLIAWYENTTSDSHRKKESVTNVNMYYKSGSDAATVNKTGYSTVANRLTSINKVESDGF
jgi:hypothetical protein